MRAFTGRYPNLSLNGSEITIRFVFLFLCLFFSFISFGQFKFESLSANKDLSSKRINDIIQDSRGFLIIATNNGLYKFDGYTMQKYRYDLSDTTALSEIVFSRIFKDSEDHLWVVGRNLYFFNQDKDIFIKYNFHLDISISAIYEYNKENLIIISSKIAVFNKKTREYIELCIPNSINDFNGSHTFLDKDRNLWIIDNGGNFSKIKFDVDSKFSKISVTPYSLKKTPLCIYQTSNDKILLGTLDGCILEYDKKNEIFSETTENKLKGFTHSGISRIYEDHSGTLWFVCKDGLFAFIKKQQFASLFSENVNDQHSLISNKINCLYEDKYGVLWIGSANGICSINPNTRHIDYLYKKSERSNDIPSNIIYSIYKDDSNLLWLSTDNGLVSVNSSTSAVRRYLSDPVERNTKKILFNAFTHYITGYKNYLLISGYGMNKIDFGKGIYQYASYEKDDTNGIPGWSVMKIVKSKDSGVYIIITRGGIAKVTINDEGFPGISKMKEKFYRYIFNDPHADSINASIIWDAYEDRNGWLWIGTNHGLFSFDPDKKKLKKYPLILDLEKIHDYNVCCICEDHKHNIWIGTEGYGLNKLIRGSGFLKNISAFPKEVAWGILDDKEDNLWISSGKGLIKYNILTENVRVYDVADGLLNEEFTRNGYYKDCDGKMYFGSYNGLISFFPDKLKSNLVAPDVWINELYIFNKTVDVNDTIEGSIVITDPIISTKELNLSYKHKVFSIGFSGIHLQSPANNRFAYFLEGFDRDWTYINAETRKANYTNLTAGKYRFRVKAANADGIWSEEKILLITVHPPFWKTWWFRILLFVLLTGSMISFYYIRINRIKARNILLEKQVAERTHELEVQADNMKEINLLLKDRNEEVISQADELSRLNATKDKFFSIIAHDLKNPFQAITGLSDLLLYESSQFDPAKVREFITMIRDSSVCASSLLQNLLQWSRNQTNSIDFKPELFDLSDVVNDIVTLLRLNAQGKNITLQNNVPHKSYLYADRNMIHTVIRNLVNNSIKYTPNDGIVSVSSTMSEKHSTIYVKDNGVGMDEEVSSKLFRIEKHVSTPGTKGEAGTGLGLIICKDFILKNNGNIRVESQPGQGTMFIIDLPLPPDDMKLEQTVQVAQTSPDVTVEQIDPKVPDDSNNEELEDLPILLAIDDDEKIRVSILNFFAKKYQVIVSPDGKDGYEKAISECPDIIISDVNMPEINGFDLCQKLKRDERTSHIPIILLTANVGEIPTIKGFETGADDYITKPFNLRILTVRVRNLIDSRKKLRELFSKQLPVISKISGISQIDERFLEKVNEFVNKNISNTNLNADFLASELAMTTRTLYRKIKSSTNQTVHEYIKIIRLKKALELLQKGTANVSDIAIMVGFNDRHYFSMSFKKLFGKNPSDIL